jgi:hypothetical protein
LPKDQPTKTGEGGSKFHASLMNAHPSTGVLGIKLENSRRVRHCSPLHIREWRDSQKAGRTNRWHLENSGRFMLRRSWRKSPCLPRLVPVLSTVDPVIDGLRLVVRFDEEMAV